MGIKITKRSATQLDFLKMKKHEPFSSWRGGAAKAEKFSLMFGARPGVFRKLLQGSNFSVQDCKDYIKMTHSEGVYNDICAKMKKGGFREYEMRPDVECWYLAAATVMREAFLSGYKGLADRITREHVFALQHKYSRNYYGAVRWHPELSYMNIDPLTGKPQGVDKKYYSWVYSHLMNNAANTNVQTGETVFIYGGWINTWDYIQEWELRSKLFNSIHDSLDTYTYKAEKELMKSTINTCVQWRRYPFFGIPHRMDSEVSDIRDYEHLQDHFYKHGEEESAAPIEPIIEEYNRKYTKFGIKEIQYHGCRI